MNSSFISAPVTMEDSDLGASLLPPVGFMIRCILLHLLPSTSPPQAATGSSDRLYQTPSMLLEARRPMNQAAAINSSHPPGLEQLLHRGAMENRFNSVQIFGRWGYSCSHPLLLSPCAFSLSLTSAAVGGVYAGPDPIEINRRLEPSSSGAFSPTFYKSL